MPELKVTTFELMSRASNVEAMEQFAPDFSEEVKKRGTEEVDRAPVEPPAAPATKKKDEPDSSKKSVVPMVQLGLAATDQLPVTLAHQFAPDRAPDQTAVSSHINPGIAR